MNELPLTDAWIVAQRPPRPRHDPWKPHGFLVEGERTRQGRVEEVATIFLVNRECPFRCLMCDLWKYTIPDRVPDGAIVAQLRQALNQLAESHPGVRHVKLYNAGNFFDAQAIPPGELPSLAELLAPFETIIVECHPKLIGSRVVEFQDRLRGELQVAMGLETVHPEVLPRLNKRMTLDDFAQATRFLNAQGISVRAFLLVRPPWLSEEEGVIWAKRSLDWAFAVGVECCVLIPTRAGNGAMEVLQARGQFSPPSLNSLEAALRYGLSLQRGRVFADLWEVHGSAEQLARLERLNREGRA